MMPRTGVDYADYNITVYREPCPYQCRYCWAWRLPLFKKRIGSGKYVPVDEARKIAVKCSRGERVVVSFTSDPYPFREAWLNITRNVIFALRSHGCPTIMILTKNPVLALKDRDIMLAHITGAKCYVETWLGTTITSADIYHKLSTIFEPHAPRTDMRLRALNEYAGQGGKVWISLEPIIPAYYFDLFPENILGKILDCLDPEKIALIVLGKLNYVKQIRKYLPMALLGEEEAKEFYREHIPIAIDLLKQYGIPYHIKKELAKVIE